MPSRTSPPADTGVSGLAGGTGKTPGSEDKNGFVPVYMIFSISFMTWRGSRVRTADFRAESGEKRVHCYVNSELKEERLACAYYYY